MKKVVLILLVILTLAAGWAYYQRAWFLPAQAEHQADASKPLGSGAIPKVNQGPTAVYALGRLEPAGGVIDVAAAPGDRLIALTVSEGDPVKQGAEIGHFESRILREREVALADAQLQEAIARRDAEVTVAQARLESAQLAEEQLKALSQLDLEALVKQIASLQTAREQAEKDRVRLTRIDAESPELISKQELEHQELAMLKARDAVQAAEDNLAKLIQSTHFKIRAVEAERKAAEAGLQQAQNLVPVASLTRQKELAEERLKLTTLRAPIDGHVLRIGTHPGESVGARPILQLAELGRMVCVAEVYDNQIHEIQNGQTAFVRSKAFAGSEEEVKLEGKVVRRKGNLVSSPEMKPLDPYAPVDRHVIQVRIELDDASSVRAAEFIHLQVDVEFPMRAGRVAQAP